jgi:hypothetical protein
LRGRTLQLGYAEFHFVLDDAARDPWADDAARPEPMRRVPPRTSFDVIGEVACRWTEKIGTAGGKDRDLDEERLAAAGTCVSDRQTAPGSGGLPAGGRDTLRGLSDRLRAGCILQPHSIKFGRAAKLASNRLDASATV